MRDDGSIPHRKGPNTAANDPSGPSVRKAERRYALGSGDSAMTRLRRLSSLAVALVPAVFLVAVPLLTLWTPAASADRGGSLPQIGLLGGSTFWVTPSDPLFTIRFSLSPDVSPADFAVETTVFDELTTRTGFDETKHGSSPTGALSSSDPVPLGSIASPLGGYTLTLGIDSGDALAPREAASLDLECERGTCAGVYPIVLRLVPTAAGASTTSQPGASSSADAGSASGSSASGSSASGGTVLTYLVYTYSTTEKLDFAWSLPLGLSSPTAGPEKKRGSSASPGLGALSSELAAISSNPDVPLTLEPVPNSIVQLKSTPGSRPRQLVESMEALSDTTSHQILSQSYVPVDVSDLVDSGLGAELGRQVHRAEQVLAGFHGSSSTWVSGSTLDPAAVSALSSPSAGAVRRVVVPSTAVTGGGCGVFTCTQPFNLSGDGNSSVEAVMSDPGLESDLPSQNDDPVLAAHRLLAELALIYFEQPNAVDQRGVVLATSLEWEPDATFIRQVLEGLDGSPILDATTLDQLFDTTQVGGNSSQDVQPANRRPSVGSVGDTGFPARDVRLLRARLGAFASSVAPAVVLPLDDLLLASESNVLTPAQQHSGVAGAHSALDDQLSKLKLTTVSVRLTSSAARVPISVTKDLPYNVSGLLTVTSDKLVFGPTPGCKLEKPATGGFTAVECDMDLDRGSNAVYVDMRSRVAGNFVVSVDLRSNTGALTLVDGTLTVRSMSTSGVAIALSIGAAAVLLAWWGRTLWRGRRRGVGAHVRGSARSAS